MPAKLTEEQLIERFASKGKTYIREYRDEKGKRRYEYRCKCGRSGSIKAANLYDLGDGCYVCNSALKKLSYDEIKAPFDALGLVLEDASTYETSFSSVKCSCPTCGFSGYTVYAYVQQGCMPCKCPTVRRGLMRRGDKHPLWKEDRSQFELRDSFEYKEFRKEILRRDRYTCQVCGSKRKLQMHHLFPFSEYDDLRMAPENCLTVCFDCHDTMSEYGFHHLFGTRNTTPFLFWAYVDWRRKQLGICDVNDVKEVTPNVKIARLELDRQTEKSGGIARVG